MIGAINGRHDYGNSSETSRASADDVRIPQMRVDDIRSRRGHHGSQAAHRSDLEHVGEVDLWYESGGRPELVEHGAAAAARDQQLEARRIQSLHEIGGDSFGASNRGRRDDGQDPQAGHRAASMLTKPRRN